MARRYIGEAPGRRTGHRARVFATALLAVSISALLARSWALAMQPQGQEHGFQNGTLRLEFVEGTEEVAQGASMEAGVVLPGSAPIRIPLTIRNTGDLTAAYTLSADLAPSAGRSLDDVLVLTVTDPASGEALYSGKLSELSVDHSSLKPGDSMTYVFEIYWATSANDHLYQGLTLGFSPRADAQAA